MRSIVVRLPRPYPRRLKSDADDATLFVAGSETACPVSVLSDAIECIDVRSPVLPSLHPSDLLPSQTSKQLASCGGCASVGEGENCLGISGAEGVGCHQGSCVRPSLCVDRDEVPEADEGGRRSYFLARRDSSSTVGPVAARLLLVDTPRASFAPTDTSRALFRISLVYIRHSSVGRGRGARTSLMRLEGDLATHSLPARPRTNLRDSSPSRGTSHPSRRSATIGARPSSLLWASEPEDSRHVQRDVVQRSS